MDGGTTNLVAARIIPERLSTTVATKYPAIADSLSAILDLEPETGADDDYAEVGREPALRKLGGLVTGSSASVELFKVLSPLGRKTRHLWKCRFPDGYISNLSGHWVCTLPWVSGSCCCA